jgi:hypothetical protein
VDDEDGDLSRAVSVSAYELQVWSIFDNSGFRTKIMRAGIYLPPRRSLVLGTKAAISAQDHWLSLFRKHQGRAAR